MDIFLIQARNIHGEYQEWVKRLSDMEEKPKSYIGYGERIDKRKIGTIENGLYPGSFQTYVLYESDILEMRKALHEKVFSYTQTEFEKARQRFESTEKYEVKDDIEIKDY